VAGGRVAAEASFPSKRLGAETAIVSRPHSRGEERGPSLVAHMPWGRVPSCDGGEVRRHAAAGCARYRGGPSAPYFRLYMWGNVNRQGRWVTGPPFWVSSPQICVRSKGNICPGTKHTISNDRCWGLNPAYARQESGPWVRATYLWLSCKPH
jgi:hypothetical protein